MIPEGWADVADAIRAMSVPPTAIKDGVAAE